ncbi:sporulation histidine kinase inhibitor Sda [Jeotgalibacillus sp. S-D1]|nr:sporulation histidine kinase inhibitor Sda [Jeotgalibacillus sp. S-D1]TDL34472.1 sporulation histidine kinase inhibitor Sda [Jeotgalibacillus sp. S-D1]
MDKLPLHILIEALSEAKRLNLSDDFINLIEEAIERRSMTLSL